MPDDITPPTKSELMAQADGGWYHFKCKSIYYNSVYEGLQKTGGYLVPIKFEEDGETPIPEEDWKYVQSGGVTVQAIHHPDDVQTVDGFALLAVYGDRITEAYWAALQPTIDAGLVIQISKADFDEITKSE